MSPELSSLKRVASQEFCSEINIAEHDLEDIRIQIPLAADYLVGVYSGKNVGPLESKVFGLFKDLEERSTNPEHSGLIEIYQKYQIWQEILVFVIKQGIKESARTIDVPAFVVRNYIVVPTYVLDLKCAVQHLFIRFGSKISSP
jgi:hypothetical protein